MGNGCLKAWKKKIFFLQRYSSDNKWNLWHFKKANFKNQKESPPALNWGGEYFDNFEQRPSSRLMLSVFGRPSPQLPILDMILAECKQLPEFAVMSKSILRNCCKKLGFCYKRYNKKQLYQPYDVLFFQAATLLKLRLRHRCFLASFWKYFSL